MNIAVPSLLRRWLTLLLAGLLALGPFLHSHVGASHETGFHLDGVHAMHADPAHTADIAKTVVSASRHMDNEESLALGVETSLPHSEDEGLALLTFALLLVLLPLLPRALEGLPRTARALRSPQRCYRAGLPPPCLAPPAF